MGSSLVSGTPQALGGLEEHALPQVGKMFGPSVRTSNNTAVSSTVTGQSVASSGSDEPSRVPVV